MNNAQVIRWYLEVSRQEYNGRGFSVVAPFVPRDDEGGK